MIYAAIECDRCSAIVPVCDYAEDHSEEYIREQAEKLRGWYSVDERDYCVDCARDLGLNKDKSKK